jgi:hypothetical protein
LQLRQARSFAGRAEGGLSLGKLCLGQQGRVSHLGQAR